jgi:hypothetical protein
VIYATACARRTSAALQNVVLFTAVIVGFCATAARRIIPVRSSTAVRRPSATTRVTTLRIAVIALIGR